MSEMKHLLLAEIKPDPNQPRKYYDESAMQELIDSVREKGVLQPILVRPVSEKDGYMIVCGERRFRAAKAVQALFKQRDNIPAVIQFLSDEEALELQIVENLQRKDVHPMEEAVAFKSLLDNKTKPVTMEELAAKVGKSIFYVRQRLKLNALSKDWQEVFFKEKLSNSWALEIAQLGENDQATLFKSKVQKKMLDKSDYEINLWPGDIRSLKRELNSAPFEKRDETLVPKAGACTTCQFNSAVSSLFPEDAKAPVCSNAACFLEKRQAAYDKHLKAAIDNPAIVLVDSDSYRYGGEHPEVKRLSDLGHKVYLNYKGDYREVTTSDKTFKTGLASGKVLKAFVVAGNKVGEHIYLTLLAKKVAPGTAKDAKEKIKAGKASDEDIEVEIKRLQEAEKRKKELDLKKTHTELLKALEGRKEFEDKRFPLQEADRGIMVFFLLHMSGLIHYSIKGIPDNPDKSHSYAEDYFKKLSKITDDQLALIIRMVARDKFGRPNLQFGVSTQDTVMRIIARYLDVDLDGIDRAQNEIAMARAEKLSKRIAELRAQKKALSKPAVKDKKPVSPKPSKRGK